MSRSRCTENRRWTETFTLFCFWEQVTFGQILTVNKSFVVCYRNVTVGLADDGWLHRAVDIDGDVHIVEELQLFDKPQPVESMVVSSLQVITSRYSRYYE